jgi:hypothetical protein
LSQEEVVRYEESYIIEPEDPTQPYLFYPSYESMSQGHGPGMKDHWEKFLLKQGFDRYGIRTEGDEKVHVYVREIPEFDPAALRIASDFIQGYRARFIQKQLLEIRDLSRRKEANQIYLRFLNSELAAKMDPLWNLAFTLRTEAERLEKKNGTFRSKDDPFDSSTW